jgi:hypothetical protein
MLFLNFSKNKLHIARATYVVSHDTYSISLLIILLQVWSVAVVKYVSVHLKYVFKKLPTMPSINSVPACLFLLPHRSGKISLAFLHRCGTTGNLRTSRTTGDLRLLRISRTTGDLPGSHAPNGDLPGSVSPTRPGIHNLSCSFRLVRGRVLMARPGAPEELI